MATLNLTEWEMLAVAVVIRMAANKGTLHVVDGKALADKLERATRVSLSLPS